MRPPFPLLEPPLGVWGVFGGAKTPKHQLKTERETPKYNDSKDYYFLNKKLSITKQKNRLDNEETTDRFIHWILYLISESEDSLTRSVRRALFESLPHGCVLLAFHESVWLCESLLLQPASTKPNLARD
jgi:hypothetical protein